MPKLEGLKSNMLSMEFKVKTNAFVCYEDKGKTPEDLLEAVLSVHRKCAAFLLEQGVAN